MRKKISDNLVYVIRDFGIYVEKQDGDRFAELEKLAQPINILIETVRVHHPKKCLVFGCELAMILSGAEQIIDTALKTGMSRKKFYKDIYQDVQSKVETFVELHRRGGSH